MLWLWSRQGKPELDVDLDLVISEWLRLNQVTDPVEQAWFRYGLRPYLIDLIRRNKVQ